MKWLVPENELDREQRKFLDTIMTNNDNEVIVGFPGSGKTILLLYAAKKMKDKNPDAKIIFIEFTHSLIKMLEAAIQELPYHDIKVVTYYDFWYNDDKKYDCIFCDEVQDIPKKALAKMRSQSKRVILAGDPNQSIYHTDPVWELPPCTREGLTEVINPDSMPLSVIHRLSRYVINAVDKFLPNMKITSGKVSMTKKHPKIRLWKAGTQAEEVHAIMEDALGYIKVGESVGILLPTHRKIQKFANYVLTDAGKPIWNVEYDKNKNYDYSSLNRHFDENGIPMQYVANGYGDFINNDGKITLMSYHSSKGLDFDRVYLPFCNHAEGYSSYTDWDSTLFMVAFTRSRGDMVISFSGMLNHFVVPFKDDCTYKNLETDNLPNLFDSVDNKEKSKTQINNGNVTEW